MPFVKFEKSTIEIVSYETIDSDTQIIAFDPGGITGYAKWDGKVLTTGYFGHFLEIDNLIGDNWTVIIERPFIRVETDPIVFQVFGVCRERASSKNCKIFIQEPSTPNFIYTKYGLRRKMKGLEGPVHARDAFCHLLSYVSKELPNDAKKLLAQAKKDSFDND